MSLKTEITIGLLVAGALSGCAAVAPAVLVDARSSYATSSQGPAGKLMPADLYDAKKVLDQANAEFARRGDTLLVRDYAYIVQRKVELADTKARTELDRQRIADTVKRGIALRDHQVKVSQDALASTREQLDEERSANEAATTALQAANAIQGTELERTAEQLDEEKEARMTAEAKLARVMRDLATIAAVKEEARGVVITLSGSVLFATNQYTLLETARTRLDQVAEALKAQADDKRMVVEGHTDSQGSDAINEPLSLNRAMAVREYLISRGVDAQRITAVGMGSRRPLVDNNNAENRANNRRVEIIIQPAPLSAR